MKKWRIDWTSYDTGYEIIDAKTREEALKKFRELPFETLFHGREPYGEITGVKEVQNGN